MKYKVLAVDDEQMILDLLKDHFEAEDYIVYTATDGDEALRMLTKQPDIILLDITMPRMDGMTLCKQIRNHVSCPILFLTARVEEIDKIEGLQAGGDDYIVKPFSLEELTARVEAHIRRDQRKHRNLTPRFYKDLVIDYKQKTLYQGDTLIELSKREFDIIEMLSMHAGQVFDKETIYETIWGLEAEGDSNVIKEHIRKIRLKLKQSNNEYILTVWGIGYKWIE